MKNIPRHCMQQRPWQLLLLSLLAGWDIFPLFPSLKRERNLDWFVRPLLLTAISVEKRNPTVSAAAAAPRNHFYLDLLPPRLYLLQNTPATYAKMLHRRRFSRRRCRRSNVPLYISPLSSPSSSCSSSSSSQMTLNEALKETHSAHTHTHVNASSCFSSQYWI